MEFAAGIELGSIPNILDPIFFSQLPLPEIPNQPLGIWEWDRKIGKDFGEEPEKSLCKVME